MRLIVGNYTNTMDVVRKTYKSGGTLAFFKGFWPSTLSIFLFTGIDLSTYEHIKLYWHPDKLDLANQTWHITWCRPCVRVPWVSLYATRYPRSLLDFKSMMLRWSRYVYRIHISQLNHLKLHRNKPFLLHRINIYPIRVHTCSMIQPISSTYLEFYFKKSWQTYQ